MKIITLFFLALLVASPAAAQEEFCFTIAKPKPLAKKDVVCPVLWEQLEQPAPWNDNICMKRLAIRGMGEIWYEIETRAADADYRARRRAARTWEREP